MSDIPAGIHLSQLMNLEIGFRDEEGRLLAENKAPLELRSEISTELSECPYTGSRYRHYKPMNVSALRQMVNHWPLLSSVFNALREFCVSQKGANTITLLDLFKLTVAGYMVPSY